MRIKRDQGGLSDSHPSEGETSEKTSNNCNLHLLDMGTFKKPSEGLLKTFQLLALNTNTWAEMPVAKKAGLVYG